MAVFPVVLSSARDWRKSGHLLPIISGLAIAAAAVGLVVYLLWPTWRTQSAGDPTRLPVSVGGTLFNVPTAAIRIKIQRRTGPQERVDLSFAFPSLEPPAPKHVTAEMVEDAMPPIDRIFVSIAAHHDALSPDARVSTIYPRYLAETTTALDNGLTMRAFRDGTPYSGEDLFSADPPNLTAQTLAARSLSARCTRDGSTPGMCLSERRVGGADLIFRFPRSWLAQWRDVAEAMDRLTVQLHGAG
ncbi:hypothetical protein [Bradyrhizobium sp. STM 3562]|uniref:hypothetical protein n=1 Tax=Bradyrhizobium sp. STM 3562 TaxID=578924 RepID=UPI0038909F3C